jgi:hypothetical protein
MEEILSLTMPDNLKTPSFEELWRQWVDVRMQQKRPAAPVVMFRAQLKRLSGFGMAVAEEAINASISNGWQGLFPEKVNQRKPFQQAQKNPWDGHVDLNALEAAGK